MKFHKSIFDIACIIINTAVTFAIVDLAVTALINTRGFSQFFESSTEAGFINKRNFKGVFGGPLDDFSSNVDISEFGTRRISNGQCKSKKNPRGRLILVGDSMTAGFEVENNQTYAAIISQLNCEELQVINGGVRAHDTHMAIANAFRISREMGAIDNSTTSAIIYLATSNDFTENNDKDAYFSMKSKFGSFYDGKHSPPAKTQWINNIRMFVGDKMYFTTKAIKQFEIYKSFWQPQHSKRNPMNQDMCLRMSHRALTIYDDSILRSGEKKKHIFYIGVHPNTVDFEFTEKLENCIKQNIWNKSAFKHIQIIPIHRWIRNNNPSFINNPSAKFRRDSHYSAFGHNSIAKALNELLIRNRIVKQR